MEDAFHPREIRGPRGSSRGRSAEGAELLAKRSFAKS
jgi:hypothetical protein